MFEIRNSGEVSTAPNVQELFHKMSSMRDSHIAVHYSRRNGMKRVVFVTVTSTGAAVQTYGMGSAITASDFAI